MFFRPVYRKQACFAVLDIWFLQRRYLGFLWLNIAYGREADVQRFLDYKARSK